MSERLAGPDRAPTEALARLYGAWAAGGAGLLITGNVMVDPAHLGERGNVAAEDDRHAEAWRAWAEASRGSPTWVQINHPGRQAPRRLDPAPVAPSAVGLPGTFGAFAVPRALTEGEVEGVVRRFATTARVVKDAGFAGVQVHAAHGYLVSQFLSPRTNLRTDRWGGDLAGRARFLLEVVRAIRAEVGPAYPVGVKLNTADFQKGAFSEDDAIEVAAMLEAERIDLLELSGGTYERAAMFAEPVRASTAAREAFFLDQAERVRKRVRTPLMLTGGFRTREGMAAALAGGAVDVVGLARPLAVEPDLCRRLLDGTADRALTVELATGIPQIDAMLTGSWYQVQMDRIADGRGADPGVWRISALTWYLRDLFLGGGHGR
ncbi:MAG: NADH:flavin oxidoreductase [Alphaproteobacteria bacterium]|nr:NADH:flavin oxidoreductase [Alphaproteobacteria bacterium]MCB9684304.1 NADH:flavin oxidoreductase [Alphaproteobacteria bacterium]